MNLGFPEMIFLFLLALLIFGPKKLPEVGRQIGRALNEFKRASNEFKAQIENEISNLDIGVDHTIFSPTQSPAGAVAALSLGPEPPLLEAEPVHAEPVYVEPAHVEPAHAAVEAQPATHSEPQAVHQEPIEQHSESKGHDA